MSEMLIFVYNKNQIFVPNYASIFGSDMKYMNFMGEYSSNKPKRLSQYLKLTRINWKSIDNPKERCVDTTKNADFFSCIRRFISHKIGCYVPNLMPSNGYNICDKPNQWEEVLELYHEIRNVGIGSKLYNLTGCLSSCEKGSFIIFIVLLKNA